MINIPTIAPFPWFGGKKAVAAELWARFGEVENYVEPFFGSGAVLLARPNAGGIETANDADGFVANFWRALAAAPGDVAQHADWPVSERDLEARHYWLVTEGRERLARILGCPFGFDAQVAGWWVWGVSAWIGSGWCSGEGPWQWNEAAGEWAKGNARQGVNRQLPHLGNPGQGVNRQLPHLGDAGQGIAERMRALAMRLRRVRFASGDFARVLGPCVTWRNSGIGARATTAVFLDPPYSSDQHSINYGDADDGAAVRARKWAIANGDNPRLRIALCGYDGEHAMPGGWVAHAWKAQGGYGSQGAARGRENAAREVVWFSPHCIAVTQQSLFGTAA